MRRVPTIVDLVPAADWDEREAHDLHGLRFDGHDAAAGARRRIPTDLDAWTTPVRGDGVHQVAVGPIHAGVIESGHFRFHVVGERILHARPAALLQASRPRARGRGRDARPTAWPTPSARAPPARSTNTRRLRAGRRGSRSVCGRTAPAAGAHAAARARAPLQPPQRHRRDLRRRRLRRPARWRSPRSRSARSGSTQRSPAIASCSTPSPSAAATLALDAPAAAARARSSRELRADAARGLARAAVRRLGAGAARRRRRPRPPTTRGGSAPSGPPRAPPACAIDARSDAPAAVVRAASRPRGRRERDRRRRRPPARCAPPSSTRRCDLLDELLARAARARRDAAPGDAPRAIGVGARREPARRDALRRRGSRTARVARLHLRTGSYANWPALAHAAAGNLLPDFPLDQQELRALLRLRGSLMFVLLRQLHRLRRDAALGRGAPAVARAAPRRRRLVQRLRARAGAPPTRTTTCSASASNIVASPRHADVLLVTGPVTTRMADAAARRLRRDARAAPRRRARRLRARLRRPRRPRRARRRRSRTCCPSTSASPAARRRPQAIAEHLLAALDAQT